MKAKDLMEILDLNLVAGEEGLEQDISHGYCGDLLSDVMANAPAGAIWLTVQGHQNIVAVAVLREIRAIVLVNGHKPNEDTLRKADREGIPVFVVGYDAYTLAGKLYEAGIGKT